MKGMALFAAFAIAMGIGFDTKGQDITDKVVMYIPNRLVDIADIFTLNIGFGPAIKADLMATRAFNFGSGIGPTAMMVKDYNRQYGFSLDKGYDMSYGWIAAEDTERTHSLNNVQEYWYNNTGTPKPSEKIYDMHTGARDYWAVGGSVACLVKVEAALNPIDIADLVTGFFFYDLKGDDYTIDNISY